MQKRLTEQGLRFLEAGQFDKACEILSLLIKQFPENADAHHMLGIIELEKGNYSKAYILVNTAIDIEDNNSIFYNTMGNIELHRNNIAAAEHAFLRAIQFDQDKLEYQYNLANFYLSQNQYSKAIDYYYSILRTNPTHYLSIRGITVAYLLSGEFDIALEHANEWVEQYPDYDEPYYYQGLCNYSLFNINAALAAYDKGLKISPTNHEIILAISTCYRSLGNLSIAEAYAHNALSFDPRNPNAIYHLGCIHFDKGEIKTAQDLFYNAKLLDNQYIDPLCGLGTIETAHGRDDLALEYFAQAAKLDPQNKLPQRLKAQTLLRQQNFFAGWDAYCNTISDNALLRNIPKWCGDNIAENQTLLVWTPKKLSELGNQILFASMLQDLRMTSSNVIVLCDNDLGKLLQPHLSPWRFISKLDLHDIESNKYKITHQIPLSHLGKFFRLHTIDFEAARNNGAYLQANPKRTAHFNEKYASMFKGKKIIGIAWKSISSDNMHITDYLKSAHIHKWQELLKLSNCQFISLQTGDVAHEIQEVNSDCKVNIYVDPEIKSTGNLDLAELSAQIASMDLVISVDNFILQLAGGLNVEAYALISMPSAWYWFKGSQQSLWYPSMQVFQQNSPNQWQLPLQNIANAINVMPID